MSVVSTCANANMSKACNAVSLCRNSSVMSVSNVYHAFLGTPCGVSFFAFFRFFGYCFYYFYFTLFTKCSTAISETYKRMPYYMAA